MAKKSLPLNYTFLLDASGSMRPDAEEVRQELNAQIKELKTRYEKLKRTCQVSLHLFNRQIRTLRKDIPIQNIKEIERHEYKPWGYTALLDAMGHTLEDLNDRLGKRVQKKKTEVVLVVFTDGRENASKAFSEQYLNELVNDLQNKKGWQIAFVGTDLNGIIDAKRAGIKKDLTRLYSRLEKGKAIRDIKDDISAYYAQETKSMMRRI